MDKYILVDGKPVLENNIVKWCMQFEDSDRQIALDCVGDSEISTVFLGT